MSEEGEHEGGSLGWIVFPMLCSAMYLVFEEVKEKAKFLPTIPTTSLLFIVSYVVSTLAWFLLSGPTHETLDRIERQLTWGYLPAHDIMNALLPPLIFYAAYKIDWYAFRKDIGLIVVLTLGVYITSTALLGCLFMNRTLSSGWDKSQAWLLAAELSATDPVATVHTLEEIGAPLRLRVIMEGESLLNDGVAILCYNFFRLWLMEELGVEVDWRSEITSRLIFVSCSIPFGIFSGFAFLSVARYASLKIRNNLTLVLVPLVYINFIIAEELNGSGVLACFALGVTLAASRDVLPPETQTSIDAIFTFLDVVANAILMSLSGYLVGKESIQYDFLLMFRGMIWYMYVVLVRGLLVGAFYLIHCLLCLLSNSLQRRVAATADDLMRKNTQPQSGCNSGRAPSAPSSSRFVEAQPLWFGDVICLVWGGMRGSLSLLLSLNLQSYHVMQSREPESRIHQNLIITSGAVLMSLLLQGGTFEAIARVVSIDPPSQESVRIEEEYMYDAQCKVDEWIRNLSHSAQYFSGANWVWVRQTVMKVVAWRTLTDEEMKEDDELSLSVNSFQIDSDVEAARATAGDDDMSEFSETEEEEDEEQTRRFPSRHTASKNEDKDKPSAYVLFTYWNLMLARTEQLRSEGLIRSTVSAKIKINIRNWRDSGVTVIDIRQPASSRVAVLALKVLDTVAIKPLRAILGDCYLVEEETLGHASDPLPTQTMSDDMQSMRRSWSSSTPADTLYQLLLAALSIAQFAINFSAHTDASTEHQVRSALYFTNILFAAAHILEQRVIYLRYKQTELRQAQAAGHRFAKSSFLKRLFFCGISFTVIFANLFILILTWWGFYLPVPWTRSCSYDCFTVPCGNTMKECDIVKRLLLLLVFLVLVNKVLDACTLLGRAGVVERMTKELSTTREYLAMLNVLLRMVDECRPTPMDFPSEKDYRLVREFNHKVGKQIEAELGRFYETYTPSTEATEMVRVTRTRQAARALLVRMKHHLHHVFNGGYLIEHERFHHFLEERLQDAQDSVGRLQLRVPRPPLKEQLLAAAWMHHCENTAERAIKMIMDSSFRESLEVQKGKVDSSVGMIFIQDGICSMKEVSPVSASEHDAVPHHPTSNFRFAGCWLNDREWLAGGASVNNVSYTARVDCVLKILPAEAVEKLRNMRPILEWALREDLYRTWRHDHARQVKRWTVLTEQQLRDSFETMLLEPDGRSMPINLPKEKAIFFIEGKLVIRSFHDKERLAQPAYPGSRLMIYCCTEMKEKLKLCSAASLSPSTPHHQRLAPPTVYAVLDYEADEPKEKEDVSRVEGSSLALVTVSKDGH